MAYGYVEAMKADILQYMDDHAGEFDYDDKNDLFEALHDEMWISDDITGNASGSYTFNTEEAKEYVMDNIELLRDAYEELGCKDQFADDFFGERWERMDVTIRCFLLGQVLYDVLNN